MKEIRSNRIVAHPTKVEFNEDKYPQCSDKTTDHDWKYVDTDNRTEWHNEDYKCSKCRLYKTIKFTHQQVNDVLVEKPCSIEIHDGDNPVFYEDLEEPQN